MIAIDVVQGSDEWLRARMAIPTASQFHRILTKKTRKMSASSDGYMCELLAEWWLDRPLKLSGVSGAMERGSAQELEAVSYYEYQRDVDTTRIGFALLDQGSGSPMRVGCSPDRLVGVAGGLEIKAPLPGRHVANLLGLNIDEYEMQCQGCMWITGRTWWDILSYHDTLPRAIVRVERDDDFIAQIADAVALFVEKMLAARDTLREKYGAEVAA